MEFCNIHMKPGVVIHLNLYILGSETIRSTNYTDKLEISIFTAALNYATLGVYNLPKTMGRMKKYKVV